MPEKGAGYYPVFLNLKGRRVIVVGGGEVAERKVLPLLEAGARVTAIAPEVTPGLASLAHDGALELQVRPYERGDLAGADLALAATSDPQTNLAVAEEALARRIWVNVVDTPMLCSFIVPAVVRRGDLSLAISTGGKSPALARRLREELEVMATRYDKLLEMVAQVRTEVRRQGLRVSPAAWQKALTPELLELAVRGDEAAVRQKLLASLAPGSDQ